MKKRLISFLLCAVMVLTMLPAEAVIAADTPAALPDLTSSYWGLVIQSEEEDPVTSPCGYTVKKIRVNDLDFYTDGTYDEKTEAWSGWTFRICPEANELCLNDYDGGPIYIKPRNAGWTTTTLFFYAYSDENTIHIPDAPGKLAAGIYFDSVGTIQLTTPYGANSGYSGKYDYDRVITIDGENVDAQELYGIYCDGSLYQFNNDDHSFDVRISSATAKKAVGFDIERGVLGNEHNSSNTPLTMNATVSSTASGSVSCGLLSDGFVCLKNGTFDVHGERDSYGIRLNANRAITESDTLELGTNEVIARSCTLCVINGSLNIYGAETAVYCEEAFEDTGYNLALWQSSLHIGRVLSDGTVERCGRGVVLDGDYGSFFMLCGYNEAEIYSRGEAIYVSGEGKYPDSDDSIYNTIRFSNATIDSCGEDGSEHAVIAPYLRLEAPETDDASYVSVTGPTNKMLCCRKFETTYAVLNEHLYKKSDFVKENWYSWYGSEDATNHTVRFGKSGHSGVLTLSAGLGDESGTGYSFTVDATEKKATLYLTNYFGKPISVYVPSDDSPEGYNAWTLDIVLSGSNYIDFSHLSSGLEARCRQVTLTTTDENAYLTLHSETEHPNGGHTTSMEDAQNEAKMSRGIYLECINSAYHPELHADNVLVIEDNVHLKIDMTDESSRYYTDKDHHVETLHKTIVGIEAGTVIAEEGSYVDIDMEIAAIDATGGRTRVNAIYTTGSNGYTGNIEVYSNSFTADLYCGKEEDPNDNWKVIDCAGVFHVEDKAFRVGVSAETQGKTQLDSESGEYIEVPPLYSVTTGIHDNGKLAVPYTSCVQTDTEQEFSYLYTTLSDGSAAKRFTIDGVTYTVTSEGGTLQGQPSYAECGWKFEKNTLYLNGYNGGSISSLNGELLIVLMPDSENAVGGIQTVDGGLRIMNEDRSHPGKLSSEGDIRSYADVTVGPNVRLEITNGMLYAAEQIFIQALSTSAADTIHIHCDKGSKIGGTLNLPKNAVMTVCGLDAYIGFGAKVSFPKQVHIVAQNGAEQTENEDGSTTFITPVGAPFSFTLVMAPGWSRKDSFAVYLGGDKLTPTDRMYTIGAEDVKLTTGVSVSGYQASAVSPDFDTNNTQTVYAAESPSGGYQSVKVYLRGSLEQAIFDEYSSAGMYLYSRYVNSEDDDTEWKREYAFESRDIAALSGKYITVAPTLKDGSETEFKTLQLKVVAEFKYSGEKVSCDSPIANISFSTDAEDENIRQAEVTQVEVKYASNTVCLTSGAPYAYGTSDGGVEESAVKKEDGSKLYAEFHSGVLTMYEDALSVHVAQSAGTVGYADLTIKSAKLCHYRSDSGSYTVSDTDETEAYLTIGSETMSELKQPPVDNPCGGVIFAAPVKGAEGYTDAVGHKNTSYAPFRILGGSSAVRAEGNIIVETCQKFDVVVAAGIDEDWSSSVYGLYSKEGDITVQGIQNGFATKLNIFGENTNVTGMTCGLWAAKGSIYVQPGENGYGNTVKINLKMNAPQVYGLQARSDIAITDSAVYSVNEGNLFAPAGLCFCSTASGADTRCLSAGNDIRISGTGSGHGLFLNVQQNETEASEKSYTTIAVSASGGVTFSGKATSELAVSASGGRLFGVSANDNVEILDSAVLHVTLRNNGTEAFGNNNIIGVESKKELIIDTDAESGTLPPVSIDALDGEKLLTSRGVYCISFKLQNAEAVHISGSFMQGLYSSNVPEYDTAAFAHRIDTQPHGYVQIWEKASPYTVTFDMSKAFTAENAECSFVESADDSTPTHLPGSTFTEGKALCVLLPEAKDGYALYDVEVSGAADVTKDPEKRVVTFTVAESNITVTPIYKAEFFSEQPCFNPVDADNGSICWKWNGDTITDVVVQEQRNNGSDYSDASYCSDKELGYTGTGASCELSVCRSAGSVRTYKYSYMENRTYRIAVVTVTGTYYSDPFEVKWALMSAEPAIGFDAGRTGTMQAKEIAGLVSGLNGTPYYEVHYAQPDWASDEDAVCNGFTVTQDGYLAYYRNVASEAIAEPSEQYLEVYDMRFGWNYEYDYCEYQVTDKESWLAAKALWDSGALVTENIQSIRIPIHTGAVTDSGATEQYGLYVNGLQADSINCSDLFGDGTAKFDPATCTLTLKGADLRFSMPKTEDWINVTETALIYSSLSQNLNLVFESNCGYDVNSCPDGTAVFKGNLYFRSGGQSFCHVDEHHKLFDAYSVTVDRANLYAWYADAEISDLTVKEGGRLNVRSLTCGAQLHDYGYIGTEELDCDNIYLDGLLYAGRVVNDYEGEYSGSRLYYYSGIFSLQDSTNVFTDASLPYAVITKGAYAPVISYTVESGASTESITPADYADENIFVYRAMDIDAADGANGDGKLAQSSAEDDTVVRFLIEGLQDENTLTIGGQSYSFTTAEKHTDYNPCDFSEFDFDDYKLFTDQSFTTEIPAEGYDSSYDDCVLADFAAGEPENWHFEVTETALTLTLTNYHGGKIEVTDEKNRPLTILYYGDNIIEADTEETRDIYGIFYEGDVTLEEGDPVRRCKVDWDRYDYDAGKYCAYLADRYDSALCIHVSGYGYASGIHAADFTMSDCTNVSVSVIGGSGHSAVGLCCQDASITCESSLDLTVGQENTVGYTCGVEAECLTASESLINITVKGSDACGMDIDGDVELCKGAFPMTLFLMGDDKNQTFTGIFADGSVSLYGCEAYIQSGGTAIFAEGLTLSDESTGYRGVSNLSVCPGLAGYGSSVRISLNGENAVLKILDTDAAVEKNNSIMIAPDGKTQSFIFAAKGFDFAKSEHYTYSVKYGTQEGAYIQQDADYLMDALGVNTDEWGTALTGTVTIDNTSPKFGNTLTADVTKLDSDEKLTYHWLRSGELILGADTGTYAITKDDIGHVISVSVSSEGRFGWVASEETAIVQKAEQYSTPTCQFSFDGEKVAGLLRTTNLDMEYSLDGGTSWTDCAASNTDLTKELSDITAEDDIWVRYRETDTVAAGEAQKIDITKAAKPAASFSAVTMKLTGLTAGLSYKIGAEGAVRSVSGTEVNLNEIVDACSVYVWVPASGTVQASDAQTITVTKAATPNLTVTQPTTVGGKGSIPTSTAHEYSTDRIHWTSCTGTAELAHGTYYVRVKAHDTELASDAQKVVINEFIISFRVYHWENGDIQIKVENLPEDCIVILAEYDGAQMKAVRRHEFAASVSEQSYTFTGFSYSKVKCFLVTKANMIPLAAPVSVDM